jgi:hypothetical protein
MLAGAAREGLFDLARSFQVAIYVFGGAHGLSVPAAYDLTHALTAKAKFLSNFNICHATPTHCLHLASTA